jgi:uncharacterized membrane protein (UPF0127 family)
MTVALRARSLSCAIALVALALGPGCRQGAPPAPGVDGRNQPQKLPTATLRVGDLALKVEVAATEAHRQKGMMFRERLGPDEAMLFVFPGEDYLSFWMKNTPVDLDLAYIRSDGTIAQIEPLVAWNTEAVPSREPVEFALETPAGWLEAHGIKVGAKVAIPPEVRHGQHVGRARACRARLAAGGTPAIVAVRRLRRRAGDG